MIKIKTMNEYCPILPEKVDEHTTRLNALFTVGLVSVFLFSPYKWALFLLMGDFLLRSYWKGRFSPVKKGNRLILKIFNVKPSLINAGPKIFAARLGLMFCILSSMFFLAGFFKVAVAIAGLLGFFALLEGAFGICVACKVYPYLFRD